MRAARRFLDELGSAADLSQISRVAVELYGSLALTGVGHGTDRAVLLGLSGELPEEVDPVYAGTLFSSIQLNHSLLLAGKHQIPFDLQRDLIFHGDLILPGHPNALRFTAFRADGSVLARQVYYSVGGGSVIREGEPAGPEVVTQPVPHPFSSAAELLAEAHANGLPIWLLMLENESALRSETEVRHYIQKIWSVMQTSIERGLTTEGILPGGLNVRRRAPRLYAKS